VAAQAPAQPPSVEEVLKKLREDLGKSLKEAEAIAASAQQSLQQLARLSEELRKLAEELRKPPRATTTTTTGRETSPCWTSPTTPRRGTRGSRLSGFS